MKKILLSVGAIISAGTADIAMNEYGMIGFILSIVLVIVSIISASLFFKISQSKVSFLSVLAGIAYVVSALSIIRIVTALIM